MKINEKIRLLRETKNWSQEEMANQLGMSTNGYSKIERGESKINTERLEQIANILDMDILELISIGERNVVFFQESDNNLNIIGASDENMAALANLKKELFYKDEIIAIQKREISMLQEMIEILKQSK
ncbi:helix-turn-helix domain-containing protein [Ursidibacter arcticus]